MHSDFSKHWDNLKLLWTQEGTRQSVQHPRSAGQSRALGGADPALHDQPATLQSEQPRASATSTTWGTAGRHESVCARCLAGPPLRAPAGTWLRGLTLQRLCVQMIVILTPHSCPCDVRLPCVSSTAAALARFLLELGSAPSGLSADAGPTLTLRGRRAHEEGTQVLGHRGRAAV